MRICWLVSAVLVLAAVASAQTPEYSVNPRVRQIVDAISEDRMVATLHKLESFGTRYVLSAQDDPAHGIGAASRWIHDEFKSYSPKVDVSYQEFTVKKGARQGQITRDITISNVIAVLPGTTYKDRYVVVTAHYDSVALIRKPYTGSNQAVAEYVRQGYDEAEARRRVSIMPALNEEGPLDIEATATQPIAPGVTDDGSGTAGVLELARVMSGYEFEKSIIFITFAGEEVGLSGSNNYSAVAKKAGMKIEALLNNDIIGNDVGGNGRIANSVVRLFAAPPEDSLSRQLARYVKEVGERLVPSMTVNMILRGDRFMRGGDHTPFANQGYAAVRLTSAVENYRDEHTVDDTFANTSVPYAARVTRINAAALATLALAPAPPVLNWSWQSGPNKGGTEPMLSRGKSGYDAVLRWLPNTEPDLAGYAVLIRSTTSAFWEKEIWVGNVTTYTLPDVSIDDIVIGVRAVDKDGNESLVSAYLEPVLPAMITATTPK